MLLRFLKLFHELSHLSHFFRQISHLRGISTAWFLPCGLLCGVEGLSRLVLLAAVLVEPTTLVGVVSREWPVSGLAPFAILDGTALLGGSFIGCSPMRALLGHALISQFGGCSNLGLVGLGCFVGLLDDQFLDILRSTRMALGDSGTNTCVSAY